ncbi:MAG TPA: gliding motility-associated C-terminal domain-containing protein [Bacteroidia bacterium]|nr:gliding motility-associated C-terminal domain-containing protein [Bacteroidia bacterium]
MFLGLITRQSYAQSGDLDQARNGSSGSPSSPVQWVNGNAGSSNSHYLESMSVPYRMVVTGLSAGSHSIDLEWDVKQSGAFAIDYITQFNRLEPHAQFSHTAEIVNPLAGLTGINATPVTYPIPAPPSNKVVTCTGILQPQASFNALPANERVMTMYNGTAITNMQYLNTADLNASISSQQVRITFTTTNSTVVFAWGGHIGAAADWCPGNSASVISGSPYHMRKIAIDGGGGNQDRSLSAAAVIPVPPCDILGANNACRSTITTYSVSPYIGYTYSWSISNNTSGASISGTNIGTSVNVNTGNSNGTFTLNLLMSTSGFSGTCTQVITVNKPVVSETHVNYSCSNNAGSVNLTASGGFPPYSFVWSNGATTEDVSGLNAGSYTVTVSDQASCGASLSVNITSLSTLSVSSSVTNSACYESHTGTVNLNVSGGTAPYSYAWSNGSTTQNISGLGAGTYSVIVTGATGCSVTATATVTQPSAALSGVISAIGNVSCYNGNNGSVNMDVSGGTPPYNYQWNNGATTQNLSGVSAGTYAVTVTDSKGCTSLTTSISVSQPSAALAAAASSASDVSCYGGNNGSVNLNVSGGTSPYTYAWSNGASTQNLTGLSAGNYSATVTDANGCTKTVSAITISQPAAALTISNIAQTNVNCHGDASGDINISVSGGTPPYSYAWSNGGNTQDLNNVAAGVYTVVITDANGCNVQSSTITISQPAASLSGNATTTSNVSCASGANGAISLTVNGGTPAYTFAWSNGATTQNISGLYAGNYVVTITDSKGCSVNATTSINQPAGSLNSSISSSQNVSCNGGNNGSINLSVSGGTLPYIYQWSNGATTQDISGLSSGSYTVTVNDANGCINVSTAVINQPSASLNASVSAQSNVSCFGGNNGAIDLTVNGGTAPYSFSWSNGSSVEDQFNLAAGSYTVTVTDANGCTFSNSAITISQPAASLNGSVTASNNVSCYGGSNGAINLTVSGGTGPYSYNWSNGANSEDISGIPAGTYMVTVTDVNGCTTVVSGITIGQPAASLNLGVNAVSNVSCFGGNNGTINLNVSGGTGPYSYNWSNGSTSQNLNNVQSGTYAVTVTDAHGCTDLISAITVSQPPSALNSNVSSAGNVSCNGGTNGAISLNVSGGTIPYSYNWSNGSTTQNLNGIPAGNYSVTITDANGCTTINSGITISQPPVALNGNVSSSSNVSCYGGNNGSINLSVNGGTSPYSYSWSNGAVSQNISNLASGTYTVLITDNNGCTMTISGIAINQPAGSLNSSVSSTGDVNCFGGNNGSINLSVNGGTAPYSYNWSNGATTQDLNNVSAGSYSVSVTDANGCSSLVTGIVIGQPGASLNASVTNASAVSCFGGSNGSITLNVNGGTAPYSYNWSNGSTSQNLNNVSTGTYSVTITDANGCLFNINGQTITQPPVALSSSVSSSGNVNCFGGNNGSINLSVNGGTAPYSYSWSNGANTQNVSNLPSGNYTVTITDANGCTTITSGIAIAQPAAALNSTVSSSGNVNCFGGNNGSINLNVVGGTAPYSYNWSNGATTQNLNNVLAGTYNVSVTDANGCTSSVAGIVISQPGASLNGNVVATSAVSCFGGNNGSIILNVNGGTAPYSYNWSNGSTSQNLNNVPAGSYSVTITDVNGCLFNINGQTISQPPAALNTSVGATSNVSCFGGNNGSITLNVNGGTAPYSYNWSNGANTQNLSNISSGTYTVLVTDANGCTVQSSSIIIGQPASALNGSATTTQNVSCNSGANGTVTLTVTGGTAPYIFNWSTGATTQNISGLYSGTYVVTVTDAQGCIFSASAVVAQPVGALNSTINVSQNVNCFGGSNGSIILNVNGGTAPYTYTWSNGASTQNLSNLSTGTYSVTITDANGCINVASASVNQPSAALNGSASSTTNVSCFGGNNGDINLSVTGGTAPYSYQWSNGASTQNISNLATGTYTVSVTDVNGCTTIVSGIAINQPGAALNGNASSTSNVSCFGGNNGGINLSVNGGTAPYSYQWSNGANTQNITNLAAGTYTVTVTDVNGCVTTVSGIAINEPAAALNGNVSSSTNVNCFGGNNGGINLSVNGGTAPYSYQWSNGASTQNISNLAAGTYTVSVTDANGCSTIVSGIAINEPAAALSASIFSQQNINCFSGATGSVDLTVTDGIPPYTYNWSNGETTQDIGNLASGLYTCTITDANGCLFTISASIAQPNAALNASISVSQNVSCNSGTNGSINLTATDGTAPYTYDWSNGETMEDISNLSAGTYTVTVTDANGCVFTTSATVTQPAGALNATAVVTQNVNCNSGANGAIDLTATDGTAPYSFIWSNGQTTEDISNLTTGTYTVTITDANGCVFITSATVTQPAGALNATANVSQNVSCYSGSNGSIDLTATDGTSPYSYNWSNGATTEDINNLSAGTYTVTVTDANGCLFTISATITQPNAALNASANVSQNVSCYSGANGSINLTATDGTSPYSYSWSNGATTEDLNNLSAGTYTVTVTDANGCTAIVSATVTQPTAALSASANVSQNVSCYSGANGSINLTATNGTSPYSYSWSNGATTEDVNNLSAGTYTVTVTDANGCVFTTSATITQPNAALNASINVASVVYCYAGSNGSFDLTVTDGTAPYSYIWSNGATTEDLNNLSAGTYTVTITDANGCVFTTSAIITQPNAALNASANVSQNVSCYSGANGSINLTATNGTSPYSYQWSNGETTEDLNNLSAGTYTVTVTDANGCVFTTSATITQPTAALNASANVSQNVSCYSGANGSINLIATNGTSPYSYQWSNGVTTEDLNNLSAGTYTVILTDANGCVATASAVITQPQSSLAVSGSGSTSDCLNNIPGNVTISINGGTAPFTYQWSNGAISQNLNNQSAGIYTVTVTDANGCSTTGSYVITDNSAFQASADGPSEVCMGEPVTLIANSVTGAAYQWYYNGQVLGGANSNVLVTPMGGTYFVTVSNACGNFTSDSIVVKVHQVENISTSPNVIVCRGESTQLNATGGVSYEWTPASGLNYTNIPNPIATPLQATQYVVTITNEFGCSTTAAIEVGMCDTLIIPSGYSPNNDVINDAFVIKGIERFPGNKIWIYNRWGNMVYKAHDYDNKWDGYSNVSGMFIGKRVPAGTYFYVLDLNNHQKPLQGYVVVRY